MADWIAVDVVARLHIVVNVAYGSGDDDRYSAFQAIRLNNVYEVPVW